MLRNDSVVEILITLWDLELLQDVMLKECVGNDSMMDSMME